MYNQEQMQATMKQIQEKVSKYDENSLPKAYEKVQEARDLVKHIEAGGSSIYTVYEARQAYDKAVNELEDAKKFSGHMHLAKQVREAEAAKEAERVKEQQARAAEEKKTFLAAAKQRWLAVGGSAHSFEQQAESMWVEEVKKRTTQAVTLEEKFMEGMRKSGAYGSI